MEYLMKEPDQFKVSALTLQYIDKLDNSSSSIFSSFLPDEKIILIFKAYFQAINVKIKLNSDEEFWIECCNYFKDKNIRKYMFITKVK